MILLDTDILVDFSRGHLACRAWLFSQGADPIAIPGYVAIELYAGCGNRRERGKIEQEIAPFRVLWPSDHEATKMINKFADAHLSHATGAFDALIAATAFSCDLPLHTFNQKHFAAFPDLRTIQPYAR